MTGSKGNNVWTTGTTPEEVKSFLRGFGEVKIFHDRLTSIGPASDPDLLDWSAGRLQVKGDLIGNMIYADMYLAGAPNNISVNAQDTWIQITSFNADGESNSIIPDHTNDHITISETGKYFCVMSIAASSQQSNSYQYQVKANDGEMSFSNLTITRDLPVAGAIGAQPISGIISLTADDTVEIWVQRKDGGAVSRTLTIDQINLSLIMIGA